MPRVTPKPASQHDLGYGHGRPHSFYRDLLLVAEREERRKASMDDPRLRGQDPGPSDVPSILTPTDLDEVEARMNFMMEANRRAGPQKFDLSGAVASALIPSNQLPPACAELFEVAARSRAAVASSLGTLPIPATGGLTLGIVRLTGGASVAVQASENSGISETDPVFGQALGPIAYVSGLIDVSRQLLDRAGTGTAGRLDNVISFELGRAAGTVLDQQVLNGSGTSGETLGLLNLASVDTVAYTSASPTVAGLASKVGSSYANVSTGYGAPPDTLILHPRRKAWLATQTIANGESQPERLFSLYDRVIEAPATPTTLNSSTQDALISVNTDPVHIFTDSRFTVHPDPGSANLTVRFRVLVRVAVIVGLVAAVSKTLGTGTVVPAFA